ncbi:hypothetical protein [Coleofasciculus sp.]|uniref:hypothetical protein n=1 Tax=Coleofasciculus sp. TaxID=3100458 RepID=UPI003A3BCEEE
MTISDYIVIETLQYSIWVIPPHLGWDKAEGFSARAEGVEGKSTQGIKGVKKSDIIAIPSADDTPMEEANVGAQGLPLVST